MNERELKFLEIEKEVNSRGGDGAAVLDAYREYYAFHEVRMCEWLARLFDPDIGGFYYSNSARDNDILVRWDGVTCKGLPDIESTMQALQFLKWTGIIESSMELPEWMRSKIRDFTCSLMSSEDGYFYHPQWGKDISDARRGRDLDWGVGLANSLGFKLPCPSAYERMKAAKAEADGGRKAESAAIPEYLKSRESLVKHLEGLDFDTKAYSSSNLLSTQIRRIAIAGYSDVVCDFLDSIQKKDTGTWGNVGGYTGVNALLKVLNVYSVAGRAVPNPERAAMSAMDAISIAEDNTTVCYQFNTWWSVAMVRQSLKKHGGEEGQKILARVDGEMLRRAPECIRATVKKIAPFKCSDGSYSYFKTHTCPLSQGALVAMDGVKEGDINATTINSQGVLNQSLYALGLDRVAPSVFDKDALDMFISALPAPKKVV